MNQVFDFRRFTLLVGKHWSENRKKYLLGVGAMIALLAFWYGFVLLVDNGRRIPRDLQAITYFFGLGITGCFFGSILFNDIASGPKAMSYLSFPASHLEKLLCGLFYGILVFFAVYTLVFYLVNIPMYLLSDSLHTGADTFLGSRDEGVVNVFRNPFGIENSVNRPENYFFYAYLAVQSAFILGSVYFPKFSFLKTAIALLLVALLFVFFLSKVLVGILPDNSNFQGFTTLRIYEPGANYEDYKLVSLPTWLEQTLKYIVQFAFAPIFWVVTYFRIKEKQV